MRRFLWFHAVFSFKLSSCLLHDKLFYLAYFVESSIGQEQGIAAQIVHVVIAGNSVAVPRGLLNGQVTQLYIVIVFFMGQQVHNFPFLCHYGFFLRHFMVIYILFSGSFKFRNNGSKIFP